MDRKTGFCLAVDVRDGEVVHLDDVIKYTPPWFPTLYAAGRKRKPTNQASSKKRSASGKSKGKKVEEDEEWDFSYDEDDVRRHAFFFPEAAELAEIEATHTAYIEGAIAKRRRLQQQAKEEEKEGGKGEEKKEG